MPSTISSVSSSCYSAAMARSYLQEMPSRFMTDYGRLHSADQSKQLQAGANRLQIIVTPKVVSIASSGTFTFAVIP